MRIALAGMMHESCTFSRVRADLHDFQLIRGSEIVDYLSIATLHVDGVRVLVTDRRWAFTLLRDFELAGIDPLAHKIVVVKLGYLFPELRDAAPREILAMTPGYNDMDLTRLPWRYETRPIFPLDRDMVWRPLISNVAGYAD
jgi:microcystin degradation protein MlrC